MADEKNELSGIHEISSSGKEFSTYSEFSSDQEIGNPVPELHTAKELAEDQQSSKAKKSKKQNFFHRLLLSATVGLAAIITAEVIGIVGAPSVKVTAAYTEASNTAVWYKMELEGYQKGDELAVEVYNDFVRYREPVCLEEWDQEDYEESSVQFFWGEVDGLKPGRNYTVEVLCGSYSIYKGTFRTEDDSWNEQEYEPYEPVDDEPIDDEPIDDEPIDDEPIDDEPIDDEPIDDEPIDDEPVDDEPIDDEPIDDEPIDDEPVDDEPVDDEPVDEEPLDDEPDDEDPANDEPTYMAPEASFEVTAYTISYQIPIEEYTANDSFRVLLLESDDPIVEHEVVNIQRINGQSYLMGTFEGLEPEVQYIIQAIRNADVICNQVVSTDSEPQNGYGG